MNRTRYFPEPFNRVLGAEKAQLKNLINTTPPAPATARAIFSSGFPQTPPPPNFSYFPPPLVDVCCGVFCTLRAIRRRRPHSPPPGLLRPGRVAAAATQAADDTSGIRHTRKRQNYTLNIYDKPNPLSTLKTPTLSVRARLHYKNPIARATRRGGGCYITSAKAMAAAATVYDFRCPK